MTSSEKDQTELTLKTLLEENEELKIKLAKAEETLSNIQRNSVNSLVNSKKESKTHRVKGRKAGEEFLKPEENYRNLFETMIEGFCTIEMIFDADNKPVDYRFLEINPTFEEQTGLHNAQGKLMRELAPDHEQHWFDTYGRIALTGIPERFENEAKALGRYYDVHAYRIGEEGSRKVAVLFSDITERKKAEAALNSTYDLLQNIIDNTPALIYVLGLDQEFLVTNKASANLLNSAPNQMLGKKRIDYMPEEIAQIHEANDRKIIESRNVLKFQESITIDNQELTFLSIKFPVSNAKGSIYGIGGISIDITESTVAAERLRESEERFRTTFEESAIAMSLTDVGGKIIRVNRAFCELTGYTETELKSFKFREFTHPDDIEANLRGVEKIFSGEQSSFRMEKRYICKDEQVIWVDMSTSGVKNSEGKIMYLVTHIQDITERKKAEEALRQSEQRLKYHFENSPLAVVEWNSEFVVTQWTAEAENIFGWKKEETIGKRIDTLNLIYEADIPVVENTMKRLTSGNELIVVSSNRNVTKSGDIIETIWYNSVLLDENGNMASVMSLVQDVTAQKKAEKDLRQSEQRWATTLESIGDAVIATDINGRITFMNSVAQSLTGWKQDEALNEDSKAVFRIINEKTRLKVENPIDKVIEKDVVVGLANHTLLISKNGKEIPIDDSGAPIKTEDGKTTGVVLVFRDISDRKKAETLLRQNEERYRSIFQRSLSIMLIIDPETGDIKDANRAACDFYGWSHSEFCGKNISAINFLTLEDSISNMQKAKKEIKNHFFFKHRLANGEIRDVEVYTGPLEFNGSIVLFAIIHDITKRKMLESALRESEEKLRRLVSDMTVGVLLQGPNAEILLSNSQAHELLGMTEEQLLGKTSFDPEWNVIHEDGTPFPGETHPVPQVIATRQPVRDVVMGVYRPASHDRVWLLVNAIPQFNDDGSVRTVVCTFINITELREKTEKLRKLSQTSIALSKSNKAMIQSSDEIEYLKQVCDIVVEDCGFKMVWIGFTENEDSKTIRPIVGSGFQDDYIETVKFKWDGNESGQELTEVTVRTGEITKCLNILNSPQYKPCRDHALKYGYASSIVFPLKSENETFGVLSIYSVEPDPFNEDEVGLLGKLATDLAYGIATIRLRKAHQLAEKELHRSHEELEMIVKKRTRELQITNEILQKEIQIHAQQEHSLAVAEEKYRTVADHTYNWESWIGANGRYIYVSPSCHKITGYTVEEFMDESDLVIKMAHPDDRKLVESHFSDELKGTPDSFTFDFRIINREGEERWIGHSCLPIFNEKGRWIGQRASNRDITEQKKAEKILIDSKNQLRALSQRIDAVAEEERIRISREIHDELGHLLTALKYDMERISDSPDLSVQKIKAEMEGMISIVESLIDSVRKIATELRPGILDHLGLFPAIEWKINEFRKRNKITCEYSIDEMNVKFDKNQTTIIYRILQEIFTNITRHSKADKVWVSISKEKGLFTMSVTDNGKGFNFVDYDQIGSLGLMGMRERALSIGGDVRIESAIGKGTTIKFMLRKD